MTTCIEFKNCEELYRIFKDSQICIDDLNQLIDKHLPKISNGIDFIPNEIVIDRNPTNEIIIVEHKKAESANKRKEIDIKSSSKSRLCKETKNNSSFNLDHLNDEPRVKAIINNN